MTLDPHQIHAATLDHPRVLCLAAPGSGKTSVLVERICWLLDQGTHPTEILALTFTRKAAGEMRARLLAARPRAGKVLLTTFHAWCARICRRYADLIGYPPNFTVRDDQDREDLIRWVGRDLRLKHASAKRLWQEEAVRVRYDALLRESAAMDFDALEHHALEVLGQRAEEIRRSHPVVLVDEGQDTSSAQQAILDLLDPRALFVVGDPAQSIYGFRGADMAGFLELGQRPDWTTVTLPTNYRSAPAIVEAASRLGRAMTPPGLEQVAARPHLPHALTTCSSGPESLTGDLAGFLSAVAPGSMAVLAPTWRQLESLAPALDAAGIPWRLARPAPQLWESDEARLLMACLQAAANPHDVLAVQSATRRWVDLPTWAAARAGALEDGGPLVDQLPNCPGVRAIRRATGVQDVQQAVQEAGGPLAVWLTADALVTRAERLLDVAHAAITAGHEDVHALLDWYAGRHLDGDGPEAVAPDAVTLSTIHSAKGLEWPLVWLLLEANDAERGEGPSAEERRRLAYVGLTRARDAVTLCWEREPSRFVAEMIATTEDTP